MHLFCKSALKMQLFRKGDLALYCVYFPFFGTLARFGSVFFCISLFFFTLSHAVHAHSHPHATGQCTCHKGWDGEFCNVTRATPKQCQDGYSGAECQICYEDVYAGECSHSCDMLSSCSGHGRCIGNSGRCICHEGFAGSNCSKPVASQGGITVPGSPVIIAIVEIPNAGGLRVQWFQVRRGMMFLPESSAVFCLHCRCFVVCGNGRCGRESERKGESAPCVRARASEQEELDKSVRVHAFVRAHTRKSAGRMPNHGIKRSLLSHYCLTTVSLLSLYCLTTGHLCLARLECMTLFLCVMTFYAADRRWWR